MTRAACVLLACLVLVPAAAGPSTTRPSLALVASPAHVTLLGARSAAIQLRNTGSSPAVVDVARAGFSLDVRGRPRIVPRGASGAGAWLTVRPARIRLEPGATAWLSVAATLPRRAEPGDHDALVLLTTRPRVAAGVAVRMRVGVLVVVRAPGKIVRRIDLRDLRVRAVRHARLLELLVANRGNVSESVDRELVTLTLRRSGRVVAKLAPAQRRLRPHSRGILQFTYRGRLRGVVTAEAAISLDRGVSTGRAYRVRL